MNVRVLAANTIVCHCENIMSRLFACSSAHVFCYAADSPPTMSRNGPSGDFASFTSQLSPASVNRGSSEPFINELAFKEAPSVFR